MDQRGGVSDEGANSSNVSPSVLIGLGITFQNTIEGTRNTSGVAGESSQQQANERNGVNRTTIITVDIHIDDDNLSTIYTNTNSNAYANTYIDSDVESTAAVEHCTKTPKCLQKVHRFMKGSPLQRLRHNIEIWKWERSQKKSVAYQEQQQKKAIQKEQDEHLNFERNQARQAKEYINEMKNRETEGRVGYRGSRSRREAVGNGTWWEKFGKRKIQRERREWEEGMTWEVLKERRRMLREGDGTFTTIVRTSAEVKEDERRRLEHARD
ncbi:hypothetical protein ONS95_013689 [Cadophora gregata]|uniref:uncharacterized protein n=1 Tax=Cadophora gregata TaxID=51156 RepID=UPI0026DC6C5C|nr:uncharacterized protein ONS95_013689 [Cadophora gregata]KAK0113432.1 hypothetical protein ONS96_014297 [Cadophora gregata f. sp. sojae]KAK0114190.1 hypothetical protein ONS95_013689 [Cadophora gregata]